jgi:hypothetical protein
MLARLNHITPKYTIHKKENVECWLRILKESEDHTQATIHNMKGCQIDEYSTITFILDFSWCLWTEAIYRVIPNSQDTFFLEYLLMTNGTKGKLVPYERRLRYLIQQRKKKKERSYRNPVLQNPPILCDRYVCAICWCKSIAVAKVSKNNSSYSEPNGVTYNISLVKNTW